MVEYDSTPIAMTTKMNVYRARAGPAQDAAERAGRAAVGMIRFSVGGDPDRLDVQVLIQRLRAKLVAPAAHLVAAERYRRVEMQVAVHPHRSGAHPGRHRVRLADVAGPDAAAQAELAPVRARHHLIDAVERHNAGDRAEDLVPGYPHVVGDVGEHGRRNEVAVPQRALAQPLPADRHPHTLGGP